MKPVSSVASIFLTCLFHGNALILPRDTRFPRHGLSTSKNSRGLRNLNHYDHCCKTNNNYPWSSSSSSSSTTRLYKKWGPRWNPTPDSEYYRRDDDNDLNGYDRIHFDGRKRKSKFIPVFGLTRIFSLQRFLVLLNVAVFLKQIQSSIAHLPTLNKLLNQSGYPYDLYTKFDIILEQFLLGSSPTVVEGKAYPTLGSRGRAYGQSLIVASTVGPFTMDFVNQRLLTRIQAHRYLTSGFLHANLLHLVLNMNYLWRMPRWVENNGGSGNGLSGWCLYLITYLSSIVAGNFARDYFSTTSAGMSTLCLGASGGICGLNGLMFAMLQKMGNSAASMNVVKNMLFIIAYGSAAKSISNASHIGGFICGTVIGWLFGPSYSRGGSRRRLSLQENEAPYEYKVAMGSGVHPDEAYFPLKYFFVGLIALVVIRPEVRVIPEYIWKGFNSPGALSGMCI